LFFLCDESLLSEAEEKIKHEVSEANDRLFLFQPALWKSVLTDPPQGGERQDNLLTPRQAFSLPAGPMEVRPDRSARRRRASGQSSLPK